MTYTDTDILDLHTCLHEVGLSETPEEVAKRLGVTFFQEQGFNSFHNFKAWEDFLTARKIEYCFVTRVESDYDTIVSFRAYPVIMGFLIKPRFLIKPMSFPAEIISLWEVSDEIDVAIDFLDSYSELVNHIPHLKGKFSKFSGVEKIRIKKYK